MKRVVLVLEIGTVAVNVHWIFLPVTLPFTEFTLSWRAKRDNRKRGQQILSNLYKRNSNITQMVMNCISGCLDIVEQQVQKDHLWHCTHTDCSVFHV